MTADRSSYRTRYKNILFRSKLEADWAITLDTFDIRWQYEPEGRYWDDKLFYAPDFWFPEVQQWFEVKGVETKKDFDKWNALAGNWHPEPSPEHFAFLAEHLGPETFKRAYGDVPRDVWVPSLAVGGPKGRIISSAGPPEGWGMGEWVPCLVPGFGFLCCKGPAPALPSTGYARWAVGSLPVRELPTKAGALA